MVKKHVSQVLQYLKSHVLLCVLLICYVVVLVSVLDFGIPNIQHPFTYHMDEWHQLMAVRSLFSSGTSNVLGAANGPILFFLLSGLFLGPFYLFHIIDPFSITSSVTALEEQKRIFMVLRLVSLIFGIGSMILIWEITKRFLKTNAFITTLFFTITPIWIMLSNYFKYDIALIFFILLSLFTILWYFERPTRKRFLIAAIPVGCALGIKISALPLLPSYFLAYYLFTPKKRSLLTLLYGFCTILITFFFVGIPDSVISWRAYYEFFYLNIISGPAETSNYLLQQSVWEYLFSHVYPVTFGHGVWTLFLFSGGYFSYAFFYKTERKLHPQVFFLFLTLILFMLSLVSLQIQAIGNRVLVLLPFIAILIGAFWNQCIQIKNNMLKKAVILLFILAFCVQIIEVTAWLQMKYGKNPRHEASLWMKKYVKNQSIGLENIPIYQQIPDIALKEFYMLQENPKAKINFSYVVIDAKTKELPRTIIITNKEFEQRLFKKSPKKELVLRLEKEGYRIVKRFTPDWRLYQIYGSTEEAVFLGLMPLVTISVYEE